MEFFGKQPRAQIVRSTDPTITVGKDYIAINAPAVVVLTAGTEQGRRVSFGKGENQIGINLAPEDWEYTRKVTPRADGKAVSLNKVKALADHLRGGEETARFVLSHMEGDVAVFAKE
jgi:hypothetical protein